MNQARKKAVDTIQCQTYCTQVHLHFPIRLVDLEVKTNKRSIVPLLTFQMYTIK